jgi:lysophospholipase L1-like esterase
MSNRLMLRTLVLLAVALGAASLASAQAFQNFSTYVALGDSLTAGYMSGSLVKTRQLNSFPGLIARSAGVQGFQQPYITEPGIPPELVLQALIPSVVIVPKSATPGNPENLALPRPYNNLGVPGASSNDLLRTTGGGFHDIVLRGQGTALQQGLSLRPTAITLWIGNNDILGAVLRGTAVDGVTMTPIDVFRANYQAIVATVRASGASVAAANLPDVTTVPYATAVSRFVTDPATGKPVQVNGQPVALLGPSGPLTEGSLVLLSASSLIAQGIGVPTSVGGRGVPLPPDVILDQSEIAVIRDRVRAFNQIIADACSAASIPVVDVFALSQEFATTGRNVGGIRLSSAFLSGGIFSYDGIHLTEIGYALVANEWIKVMNNLGGSLPEIDLLPLLGVKIQSSSAGTLVPELSREALENLLEVFPRLDGR